MVPLNHTAFQQKIVEKIFGVFIATGLLLHVVKLLGALVTAKYSVSLVEILILTVFVVATVLRKNMVHDTKVYVFATLIFMYAVSNLYTSNLSSLDIVAIVIVPLFTSLLLSPQKSLVALLVLVLLYSLICLSMSDEQSSDWILEIVQVLIACVGLAGVGYYVSTLLFTERLHFDRDIGKGQSVKEIPEIKTEFESIEEGVISANSIFQNSHDAIGISKQGKIVYFNVPFLTLFGYDLGEELKGKPILDFIKPQERIRIGEYMAKRALQENVTDFYESIGLKKNGEEFPFEVNVPTYVYNGEQYTVAMIRDTTQRKLAEKALKESEERFRLLAENSTDMISRHTVDGKYLYASPACERLLGYSSEELIGRSAFDFIQPEDIDLVEESRSTILDKKIDYTVVFRVKRKDGKLVWVETVSRPINDPYTGQILEIHAASRDITERKLVDEALQYSEEKFNKIFDRAPVLISMTNFETGVYEDVNTYSLTFSGYSKDEVIGKRSVDLGWISLENRKLLVDTIATYGKIEGLEMPFKAKNGNIVYGIVNGEKITLHGKPYLLSIATDITARKQVEQALRESETLYANIFEHSPIGLQFYGPDGALLKLNNACLDIFGVIDVSEIKDWNLFNDPNVTDELKEALKRGEMVRYMVDFDFELVKSLTLYKTTKSGIRVFDVSLSSLDFGYFAQIIDVTERQKAEKDLLIAKTKAEESEKRFVNAIAATSDAVWEWNLITNVTFYSPRWYEMLGYENNEFEMNFEQWKRLCHPDDFQPTIDKISYSLSNSISYSAEFRMQAKDGNWRWIRGRGNVVQRDENGKAILLSGTNTDITEQKLIDVELFQYRSHLERLVKEKTEEIEATSEEIRATNDLLYDKNEIIEKQNLDLSYALQHLKETQSQLIQTEKLASLGVLTAGVAHEINNPLNYIMGAYEGLLVVLTQTGQIKDENVPLLLDSLKIGVDRVSKIVKGLNQFSRNTNTINEKCDIQLIIDNCLVILNKQFKDRIRVEKQFPTEMIIVKGNVGKLHQVFTNIIVNSIHSISEKGTISIILKKEGGNALIEIIDTGCGISAEHLSKIFEPFFTTKEPGKGTGLGLSITYSIIKEHDGHIDFQSEMNKGTSVKITLPLFL